VTFIILSHADLNHFFRHYREHQRPTIPAIKNIHFYSTWKHIVMSFAASDTRRWVIKS